MGRFWKTSVYRWGNKGKWFKSKKALELLDKELKKYNIPNKPSKDGVARIDGMTVDEYFEKVGLW